MDVREPRAALYGFYPAAREQLLKTIEQCFLDGRFGPGRLPKGKHDYNVVAGVAPHAGYSYSGPCAAHFYLELAENPQKPETIVVIGTNHTGFGDVFTTTTRFSRWATPLGEVEVDIDFISTLTRKYPRIVDDYLAHIDEHSIEVHLPFLQYIYGDSFKLVPIVAKEATERMASELASAIHESAKELGRSIIVIASSDFTHHGPMYGYTVFTEKVRENVAKLDLSIVDKILALDTKGFLSRIVETGATVCGVAAIAVAIEYAKLVNAKARLLKYYNSADVTGDETAVVGYASIIFYK